MLEPKDSHVGVVYHPQGFFNARARHLNTIMSIKSTIAAVAASPFLFAGAAFAGPYVNVESNLSYPDGEYSAATTDVHLGYEGTAGAEGKIAYYVQGGPSLVHSETADDTETEISAKIGASYPVSDSTGVYAELSGATAGEDSDGDTIRNYGAKAGVKFTF